MLATAKVSLQATALNGGSAVSTGAADATGDGLALAGDISNNLVFGGGPGTVADGAGASANTDLSASAAKGYAVRHGPGPQR